VSAVVLHLITKMKLKNRLSRRLVIGEQDRRPGPAILPDLIRLLQRSDIHITHLTFKVQFGEFFYDLWNGLELVHCPEVLSRVRMVDLHTPRSSPAAWDIITCMPRLERLAFTYNLSSGYGFRWDGSRGNPVPLSFITTFVCSQLMKLHYSTSEYCQGSWFVSTEPLCPSGDVEALSRMMPSVRNMDTAFMIPLLRRHRSLGSRIVSFCSTRSCLSCREPMTICHPLRQLAAWSGFTQLEYFRCAMSWDIDIPQWRGSQEEVDIGLAAWYAALPTLRIVVLLEIASPTIQGLCVTAYRRQSSGHIVKVEETRTSLPLQEHLTDTRGFRQQPRLWSDADALRRVNILDVLRVRRIEGQRFIPFREDFDDDDANYSR
jgi:hypothetical protein